MKRIISVFLICILLCLCAGCEAHSQETVYAMNTVMDLQVWGKEAETGLSQVKALLQELEQDWSANLETSKLSALNRGEEIALTEEETALLIRMEELSACTDGAFDPRLLAVSRLWGFGTENAGVPDNAEIILALIRHEWDLGAALKGYAGQQAVKLLQELDVERGLLNLGGNIQTYGQKADGTPWKIGIQNPDGGDYLGIVSVTGTMSVVTSGDYQRYFEKDGVRYHHIIDPTTGMPADSGLRSVTVICSDGLTADALSTALFVMGLEQGAEFWRQSDDFEAVFITAQGKVYATEGAALSGCEFEVIHREK